MPPLRRVDAVAFEAGNRSERAIKVASQSHSANNTTRLVTALLSRGLSDKESTAYFAEVSHDTLLTQFASYLNQHRHFLGICHIEQNQALNDKGVDLILQTEDAKIGFQIKSHFDVSEKLFAANVKRQLAESFTHGLTHYFIIVCCPLDYDETSYAGKISHLLSELSQMKTSYHQAYGPANAVPYFVNPTVLSRDELLRQQIITDDALHDYEKGFEHLPEIDDAEMQAAVEKRDAYGEEYWDSVEGMQAATELEQLFFKKKAAQFMEQFIPTIPEDVKKRRLELTAQIQDRLKACRSCASWDDRSEYKLSNWLEWVDEAMIPYTSLPNLIRLKANIDRYYRIHAATDEQMQKHGKHSPYDLNGMPPATTLSDRAQTLLLQAACDKHGLLMIVRTTNGTFVQTNGQQFIDGKNPRSEAECLAAVQELERGGYLDRLPEEGESFTVTATGFSAVDDLRDVSTI
jgi:hypothetical protein